MTNRAHDQVRTARVHSRSRRRNRGPILLAGGSALTLALATTLSVAAFNGIDLAGAAVDRAKSFVELMRQRSPGERTAAELTKIKHKAVARPHERALAKVLFPPVPRRLVDVLVPPPPPLLPVDLQVPPIAELTPAAFPPPAIIFSLPPGGGGFFPPPAGGPPILPPPPPPPPPVPEPGTWLTMILGFGVIGVRLRRRRSVGRFASI